MQNFCYTPLETFQRALLPKPAYFQRDPMMELEHQRQTVLMMVLIQRDLPMTAQEHQSLQRRMEQEHQRLREPVHQRQMEQEHQRQREQVLQRSMEHQSLPSLWIQRHWERVLQSHQSLLVVTLTILLSHLPCCLHCNLRI